MTPGRSTSDSAARRMDTVEERKVGGVPGVMGEKGLPEVRVIARVVRAASGARGV